MPSDRERYQTVYARDGAPSRRQPPVYTSRQKFWIALERAAWKSRKSRSTSASEHLNRFAPNDSKTTKSTPRLTTFLSRRRKPSSALKTRKPPDSCSGHHGRSHARRRGGKSAAVGHALAVGEGRSDDLLFPGKPIRIVNQLLTNFHLPQSSLLALGCNVRRSRKYSSRVSIRRRGALPFLQLWRLYANPIGAPLKFGSKALEPSDFVHSGPWFVYNLPFADEGF